MTDDTVSGALARIRKIAEEELPSWCLLHKVDLLSPGLEYAHTPFVIEVEVTDLDPHRHDDWASRVAECVRAIWPPETVIFWIRIKERPEEDV